MDQLAFSLRAILLPTRGGHYVWSVIALGFVAIFVSCRSLLIEPIGPQWFLLAALTLLSGSVTVKLPSVPATISISETFVFTSVLLFGPAAGTLVVALDGLIISFWLARKRKEPYRILFNIAAPSLSVWLSSHAFYILADVPPLALAPATLEQIFIPLLAFTSLHFGINSALIGKAIAFETRRRFAEIWQRDLLWLGLNYLGGASLAALLVVYTRDVTFTYLAVIIPLLLVLYYTFKIPMARVEDATRHVAQLNRLYLSTVETLAMAIDAKDQVTHGHLRRVQVYAVELARSLGITDQDTIRAIEAAALLHDLGKLAIPEHILNKPGKLTPQEFERMKSHAAIGADLLASINFPYPVVPIVRHHHEHFDGSGYPDGRVGVDIPVGARILSVVDCFDALTSDRPYRPRWTDAAALGYLSEHRGRMYDPLVVDTFIQIQPTLARLEPGPPPLAIRPDATPPPYDVPSNTRDAEALELAALKGIVDRLPGYAVRDLTCGILRRQLGADACALFVLSQDIDSVRCEHVSGLWFHELFGLTIPVGKCLTGWVAATGRPVINGDPSLDFGPLLPSKEERSPQSTLSVPIRTEHDSRPSFVLSAYSTAPRAFAQQDVLAIQFALGALFEKLAHPNGSSPQ